MATVINAGRVAMVPKGEWASATAYTRLDVVLYNGSSWVAIADSTGQVPAEGSTYWQLLSLKGEQGEKGDKGDTGATGATGTKGDKGDTGATGATGATGPQGPKGDKGDKGDQGNQGNSGYTGAAGELEVVNNLTDGGATSALSAEMGKVIRMQVETILSSLGDYAFPNGKPSIDWSGMPYDAEVEYLQSTGTQVIDSGIVGNLDTEIEVSFKTTGTMARAIAGSRGDNTNDINLYVDGSATMRFGNKSASGSFSPNTAYTFIANKTAFTINGTAKAINATNTFVTPSNLFIFGNQKGQGAFILYYIKISKDGYLVRDFIPVRVGQVGYLYDQVSGQLFGNVGTGDFVLGNDKN